MENGSALRGPRIGGGTRSGDDAECNQQAEDETEHSPTPRRGGQRTATVWTADQLRPAETGQATQENNTDKK
jgi:hypothetical protein